MSVTRRWRWAQRLQRRTATAPSDLLLRLRQIAAECGDIEIEYLRLTGPLSQGVALAGVAPMPADLDRIADNRTRASRVERERRELLLAVTIAHRAWSELLEWFDLTPLLEVASPPLSVDWSPQASRYRERVLLRVAFTPGGSRVRRGSCSIVTC